MRTAQILGVDPSEVVFLDDRRPLLEGARDVGMTGVLVDPATSDPRSISPANCSASIPRRGAWRLVRAAERPAYQAQDLDAIMQLFHPEIVIYWNGERVAIGHAEARQFHVDTLGIGSPTDRPRPSGRRNRSGRLRATRSASSGTRRTRSRTARRRTVQEESSGR